MKDRVHQPYRKTLVRGFALIVYSPLDISHLNPMSNGRVLISFNPQIPGLPEVTSSITPASHPGLLGICLSGAGPTILALATGGFDAIAEDVREIFQSFGISIDWKVLHVAGGSVVEENADS